MSPIDPAFFALAPVAVGAGLASVLQSSLLRAACAALVAAVALAVLWALAGGAGAAALQMAFVTTAAGVLLLEPSVLRGVDGERAPLLRRATPAVLAWFALVLRVVLMTRWPVAAQPASGSVPWWAVPGVVHGLALGATMLALGFLGAASRRSVGGVASAIPLAGSGVATMTVALSRTTALPAAPLAALAVAAVASSWLLPAAALALARDTTAHEGDAAPLPARFAAGVSVATIAMALALLAGTW